MFQGRSAAWWIVPGAVLLACLYVPSLTTRFDFINDAERVYGAAPGSSATEYWDRLTSRVETDQQQSGEFRPVLWTHWEVAANTLGDNVFAWRSLRLGWTFLAAAMFLWLLHEFGFHPVACLGAAALTMWNPWRNEIWTSLTLAEGVAMPYAVFALVATLRARRSPYPWLWVLAACWATLMALYCKYTFAALVPVQLLLRAYPQSGTWRQSLRQSWGQLIVLSLTVTLPKSQYVHMTNANGLTPEHFGGQLHSLSGALSLDYIGAGLVLAMVALVLSVRPAETSWKADVRAAWGSVWDRYRLPCLAGAMMLVLGISVYLPTDGIAGRFNIPAAWGVDLWIAALFSALLSMPRTVWVRLAGGAFAVGLVGVAVANVGKQHKFATRAEMLWGVVEYLETHADQGEHVAWVADGNLSREEGVQLMRHLHHRGRNDLQMSVIDGEGNPIGSEVVPTPTCTPTFWVSSGQAEDVPGRARRMADFRTYPLARKPHHCVLWKRKPANRYVDASRP